MIKMSKECPTPDELRDKAAIKQRQIQNSQIQYDIKRAIGAIERASSDGCFNAQIKELEYGKHYRTYKWRVRKTPKRFLDESSYAIYEYFKKKEYKVTLENHERLTRYLILTVSWE